MSRLGVKPVRAAAVALATLAVIHLPLPGWAQAALLGVLWAVSFWPLNRAELLLFVVVNGFYVLGDVGAVSRGVFAFAKPDLWGLPYWEFGMWGFFVLLVHRLRPAPGPALPLRWPPFVLMALLMASFQLKDPAALTVVCFGLLALMLVSDHSPGVRLCVAWLIGVGTVLEYTCVWSGVWSYPSGYRGGVAYWYAALFGATGYFYETGWRPLYQRVARRCNWA